VYLTGKSASGIEADGSAEKARKFADTARPYVQLLLRNRPHRESLKRTKNI